MFTLISSANKPVLIAPPYSPAVLLIKIQLIIILIYYRKLTILFKSGVIKRATASVVTVAFAENFKRA